MYFVTIRENGRSRRLLFQAGSLAEALIVCRAVNGFNVGRWS
jgi:hypothetical protein